MILLWVLDLQCFRRTYSNILKWFLHTFYVQFNFKHEKKNIKIDKAHWENYGIKAKQLQHNLNSIPHNF